jgi:hypothetical protein
MAIAHEGSERPAFGRRGAIPSAPRSVRSVPQVVVAIHLPLRARIILTLITALWAAVISLAYWLGVLDVPLAQPVPPLFGPDATPVVNKMIGVERYHWAPIWTPPIASFGLAALIAWPWLRKQPPRDVGRALLYAATMILATCIGAYVTRAIWPVAVMPGAKSFGLFGAAGFVALKDFTRIVGLIFSAYPIFVPLLLMFAGTMYALTRDRLETFEAPTLPPHIDRRIELINLIVLGLTSLAMAFMVVGITKFYGRSVGPLDMAIIAAMSGLAWAFVSYPKAQFSLKRIALGAILIGCLQTVLVSLLTGSRFDVPLDPILRLFGASLMIAWMARQVRAPMEWIARRIA